jgi:autophagy-related protein 11
LSLDVLNVLDELESYARTSDAPTAAKAIAECRASLEKLISKMDNLELGFDKIAERSREFLFSLHGGSWPPATG